MLRARKVIAAAAALLLAIVGVVTVVTVAGDGDEAGPPGVRRPGDPGGLWVATATGEVIALGGADFQGGLSHQPLGEHIVAMAGTPTGDGYWLAAADGGVFAFGDAELIGSLGGEPLASPIVDMSATPTGGGYWLAAADGGVFAFGDAAFHGSLGDRALEAPITAVAATATGGGYWLLDERGDIVGFGDAEPALVDTPAELVISPVDMTADPYGTAAWVVYAGGEVWPLPGAARHGPDRDFAGEVAVVAIAATASGNGYWIVTGDGRVESFGDAPRFDRIAPDQITVPVVAAATAP